MIFLFLVFGSLFLDYGSPGLRCIRTHAYVCTRPCPLEKLRRRRRPVGFSTVFQQNAHSPSPPPIPASRDSRADRRRFRRADRRLLWGIGVFLKPKLAGWDVLDVRRKSDFLLFVSCKLMVLTSTPTSIHALIAALAAFCVENPAETCDVRCMLEYVMISGPRVHAGICHDFGGKRLHAGGRNSEGGGT